MSQLLAGSRVGAVTALFSSLWRYNGDHTIADPGQTHFRTDADTDITRLAVSTIDANNADRAGALRSLLAGDRLVLRSTATAQDWAAYTLTTTPVDLDTWLRLDVAPSGAGSEVALPYWGELVLLDFARWSPDDGGDDSGAVLPPALNSWDVDAIVTDALAVLRLRNDDIDEARIRRDAVAATELLDAELDRPATFDTTVWAALEQAAVNVTIAIYDGVGDPIAAVRNMALPWKQRWGIA